MRVKFKITLGLLSFMSVVTICVIAGHSIISSLLPELHPVAEIAVSLWCGFGLFGLLAWLSHLIFEHFHKDEHLNYLDKILGAMEQISKGNFSVLLPENKDIRFNDISKAVNDMAKNLGDLDKMRQDFISNVSHEIQSPLTSISGFAALLKTDLPEEERHRYAEIIETESKRLSGMSDNLLKLSNLDNNPIMRTEFRLDRQLQNIVLTLEPQWMAKNITFEADWQKCTVNGDEKLLSQMWVNLLHNAIKFTPNDGIISVSLKDGVVRIADTGCGIPSDELPRIFERFYKVDKARDRSLGGNGLGLSIVKKIVDLHGWTIEVESEIGKGTQFSVKM